MRLKEGALGGLGYLNWNPNRLGEVCIAVKRGAGAPGGMVKGNEKGRGHAYCRAQSNSWDHTFSTDGDLQPVCHLPTETSAGESRHDAQQQFCCKVG